MILLNDLVAAGFDRIARWTESGSITTETDRPIPERRGIYIFVVEEEIKYVGKAERSLHSRIKRYVRKQQSVERKNTIYASIDEAPGIRPSRPVHAEIGVALKSGLEIRIYILSIGPKIHWCDGLPLDRLAGLEAGLIENLKPTWNRYGLRRRAISESTEI